VTTTFYLGEKSGARVLAYGDATTQAVTDFQCQLWTWDLIPVGEVGDALFRSIDVSLNAVSGYSIGITPIVDGQSLAEQTFSGPDTGEVECQAFFAERGTRCSALVRTIARTGDITIHNVQCSFVPIRSTP
jgi:hypothetical protein